MNFSALPKIELHVHLDCSLSFDLVQKLKPEISPAQYQNLYVAPPKCNDLADYLTRANNSIQLLQTRAALQLATLDLFNQLAADQVIYAEIRFAPLEHLTRGLSPKEVVQAVLEAIDQGRESTGIIVGLLLCTLRHYSENQSLDLVHLAQHFQGTAVSGIDIAADESKFSIQNHITAFQYAQKHGINCTAHAGEARGAESVWETLANFAPQRIGHGVRSVEDPMLIDYLLEKNIHLEVCPTSNIQTNVFPKMADHSIDFLYRKGVSLSINTDARTISNVTLTQEYQTLHDVFHWDNPDFLKCNLSALEHAFIPEAVKSKLHKQLVEGFRA